MKEGCSSTPIDKVSTALLMEQGESKSTADNDEAMGVDDEKKKANKRNFIAMDVIRRKENMAMVAETNKTII